MNTFRSVCLILLLIPTVTSGQNRSGMGAAAQAARPLGAMPMIVPGQSHSHGLVIQGTDYDSAKGQTTFHLLNVSGKQINALELNLQTKLPDGTFTPSGTDLTVLDYLDRGLAPGATENIQRPGVVTGVVDLVMYSDGTTEFVNEGEGT